MPPDMDHFHIHDGELTAENTPLARIADAIGTPFYCYSTATLRHHARVMREALAAINPLICFAVKACPHIAVLRTLGLEGLGADVVSEGELRRALTAGIAANRIVFSGVGKTASEMRYALQAGIFQFNVESDRELLLLNDVARELNCRAPVAIRVNPDVDAATHAKISTGKSENKFGIAMEIAPAVCGLAQALPHILLQGISVHIGSQITSLAPFERAYRRVRELAETLGAQGIRLTTLDLGGGLGVPYHSGDAPPPPADYSAMVRGLFAGSPWQLIVEPGRLISANAGVLVSRVLYIKRAARTYVVLDAGMNDLMRPALYDSVHAVVPLSPREGPAQVVDLVGPVCESSDVFARDLTLPPLKEGDLIALRSAGAYGASMANTYNSRLLIPEVMVNGAEFAVIRPRQNYAELLERETLPGWLS